MNSTTHANQEPNLEHPATRIEQEMPPGVRHESAARDDGVQTKRVHVAAAD